MSKTTKTPKHTARPANWVDKLISDRHAAHTVRVGMTVLHLYPRSARPGNRREAATVKGELIETINRNELHYADLVALRDAVRILAGDHDGARWVCAQTRKHGNEYLARRMGKGGAGGK